MELEVYRLHLQSWSHYDTDDPLEEMLLDPIWLLDIPGFY